jgi:phosphoribosylformylglycinamidine (FGAM) synthase-like enzyme
MGKLKEKLINNLSESEMDEQYGISAFEYVELVERYKEDEYVPTDEELEKLEQMVQDYYNSKEFREYVENYTSTDEYVNSLTDEQIDEAITEYNQNELDEINDSLKVKFTEDEVIEAVRSIKNEDWFIAGIRRELNVIWNRKNGVI